MAVYRRRLWRTDLPDNEQIQGLRQRVHFEIQSIFNGLVYPYTNAPTALNFDSSGLMARL
jgi:hypothetical protein